MTPTDLKSAFIFLLTTLSALQNVTSQLPTNIPTYIDIDCDTDSGNYTVNSTYHHNLNLLLSNLTAEASKVSFYNSSVGPTNTAYGQFYCRGDISTQLCGACVKQAAANVTSVGTECSGVKAGKVWYEECTLIYDDKSNVGVLEISDTDPDWSYIGGNVSDSTTFEKVLEDSFGTLIARAADTSSSKGFATGDANVTKYAAVYCLVQCSPDLTGQQCESCLKAELNYLVTNYSGHYREGMLLFYQNCQLRYSTPEPFYLVSSDPAPTPTMSSAPPVTPSSSYPVDVSPSEKDGKHNAAKIVVPIVVGSILLICGVCLGIWFYLSRSTSRIPDRTPRDVIKREDSEIGSIECFSFAAMEEATMKFSHDNKLGEGGFGMVYKGMRPNGKPVAIKRLSKYSSSQGIREFKTEVGVVAKLQHRNLVRLLGYCDEHEEHILVYEYLPNLSLDKYLFDATMSVKLEWKARYKIIEGVASGLRYLHIDSLLTIIHRDLKPSNILLDEDMNPKIADFGMAKLVKINETMGNTSRVVGTFGYMPPEYAMKGRFSTKSDVYSFGVIMLEILSGKSSNHFYDSDNGYGLHHHAWKIWNDKAIEKLVDPTLQGNYSITEAERCLQIGLLCIQDDAEKRPTIRVVMSMLENPFFELPSPSVPSSFHSSISTISANSEGGETLSSISSRV